jgi:hypothetical protein
VNVVFGELVAFFQFVDVKKHLKVYLQPVGTIYRVAVLLTNIHTCVNGSITTSFLGKNILDLRFTFPLKLTSLSYPVDP